MQPEFESNRVVFCASTGRTATMFLATCLNRLEGVVGLHEGHLPGDRPLPRLPLINVHNRRAWHDPEYAARLVSETRDAATLGVAAGGARLLADVAFYNAPLLAAMAERHPDALLFVIFRRCEGFVRSATITSGEDRQPAGWPCRSKPMTDREKFISLGRLRPEPDHRDHASWPDWSAVQRNIWLWTTVTGTCSSSPVPTRIAIASSSRIWSKGRRHSGRIPAKAWTSIAFDALRMRRIIEVEINRRQCYQVGPAASWNAEEQSLYAERARLLEDEIYDFHD